MPFRRRPDQPRDLHALIEAELRERLEEAVADVALEVVLARRRARGLPPPSAERPADREELEAGAQAFLERLTADLLATADPETRARVAEVRPRAAGPQAELVAVQVLLARRLPDYWQRFEAVRAAVAADPRASGREGGGLLRRLLGR